MRFRNSLRLLMENFKYVYKMLLYKCIIALVASALCCAFVLPEMIKIWESTQMQALVEHGKDFLKAILALNREDMEVAKDAIIGQDGALKGLINFLSTMTMELILTTLGVILVYLTKRVVDTVVHYTTGALLNDKMSAYAETPFSTGAVSNLGKALLYAIVYVPIVFLLDLITILICLITLSALPIFLGVSFAMTILVVLQALKSTFTVYWMPAMVNGERLRDALRSQGKDARKQSAKVFAFYLVCIYLIIIVNILACICTFGSALIISIPATYFFFICAQFVCYYTIKGRKYFLTYDRIAENPDKGDSEHFFEYIEKKETQNGEQIAVEEVVNTSNLDAEGTQNAE